MHRRATARLTAVATGAALLLPATAASAQPPFVVHGADGDLYRIDVDGSGRARLTDETGTAEEPDVSPDGTQVAYIVDKTVPDEVQRTSLRVAGIDGSHTRELHAVRFNNDLSVPRWSPSGDRIAFAELDGYTVDSEIRVVPAAGGEPVTLAPGDHPTWSPDGSELAFLGSDGQGARLRAMPVAGGDARTIHTFDRDVLPRSARWAPTGEWIGLVVEENTGPGPNDVALRFVSAETGEVKRVDPPVEIRDAESIGWTADGERIVLEGYVEGDADGTPDAVLVDPDGEVAPVAVDAGEHDVHDPDHVGRTDLGLVADAGADGDPTTTERVDAPSGTDAAIEVSRQLWAGSDGRVAEGVEREALPVAQHAVLSRDDLFADSLAGASLSSHGPLLFSDPDRLTGATADELRRVLPEGATVYLLGGTNALSAEVEQAVRDAGFTPQRLAGATRIETSLAVADEVRALTPGHERVAVARAEGTDDDPSAAWADSVTGGAFAADAQVPVVLTQGHSLHPAVSGWLESDAPSASLVLGGSRAISDQVVADLPNPTRVAGAARDATATAIAEQLWKVEPEGLRRYTVVPGYREDGWQYGLAAAGLARRGDAPLVLTDGDRVPSATATAVTDCQQVELVLLGDTSVIPASTASQLDARDRRC